MLLNKIALTILSILVVTSCGSDGTSGNGTATVLEGIWVKQCNAVNQADPNTYYDIITLTFIENNFDSSILNYTDPDCTIPDTQIPNPTASGTFVIGNTITTTGGLQAKEIDSYVDQSSGAIFADGFVIFNIDGNTLYFGDTTGDNDGSTPELRPDTLNFDRSYERQ